MIKMGGVIETQVGEFSLGEAFAIGIAKTVSERLLSGIIGNGSYLSGGVKLAGAWGVPKVIHGKYGKIIGTAMAVDGVEDIINALSDTFFGGAGNSADSGAAPFIM